jgi:hypothetical protein
VRRKLAWLVWNGQHHTEIASLRLTNTWRLRRRLPFWKTVQSSPLGLESLGAIAKVSSSSLSVQNAATQIFADITTCPIKERCLLLRKRPPSLRLLSRPPLSQLRSTSPGKPYGLRLANHNPRRRSSGSRRVKSWSLTATRATSLLEMDGQLSRRAARTRRAWAHNRLFSAAGRRSDAREKRVSHEITGKTLMHYLSGAPKEL